MALGRQVRWKPGQKEDQHGITGELTDAGANHLSFCQQLAHQRPAKSVLLLLRASQSAATKNMFAFTVAQAAVLMGFAVATPPDQREQDANNPDADKQRTPAEAAHNPEQQRRETGQPEIFTDGVDRRGLRALLLWKPGTHYPAVDRKTGRFTDAKPEATQQQRFQANRHTVK